MKRIEIILDGRKVLDIQRNENDYSSDYIALEVSQETQYNITQAIRLLQKVQSWNLEKEDYFRLLHSPRWGVDYPRRGAGGGSWGGLARGGAV